MFLTEFTVKEVTVFRVATFLNEVLAKYNSWEFTKYSTKLTMRIWTAKCDFEKE